MPDLPVAPILFLVPEIPYDINAVCKKIAERHASGSRFSIVAIAEGAISKDESKLTKKELKKKLAEDREESSFRSPS